MISRRRLITAMIGAFLMSVAVRADMVPIGRCDTGHRQDSSVCVQSEIPSANRSFLSDSPVLGDFDVRTVQFQPEINAHGERPAQAPPLIELAGGPSSVSLCLYALMSLGLCSAPHWIKKLHLGHLPEWYHDGGPFQIGHSFAATPESLCALQACYFNPPSDTAEDFLPQHRQRTIISLWRKSQFTPEAIASRGPPLS